MIRYSSEVIVGRSAEAVFEALLDPGRYAQWTPMADMAFEDAGPARVGQRARFRMAEGPIKGLLDMEIVELETNRRVAFRVSHPALDWLAVTTLRPNDQGTHVTYAGELSFRGWRRLLEPFISGEVSKGEAREIGRFKELLEGEQAPGH